MKRPDEIQAELLRKLSTRVTAARLLAVAFQMWMVWSSLAVAVAGQAPSSGIPGSRGCRLTRAAR